MKRSSWFVVLIAASLIVPSIGWFYMARTAAKPGQVSNLVMQQLDGLALEVPPVEFKRQSVSWSGDLTSWLVARLELSQEEEAKLAEDVHQNLLKANEVVETPSDVLDAVDRLVEHLPEQMIPFTGSFQVTVFDSPQAEAFTSGGGYLYVTNAWLDQFGSANDRSAPLAFLLAHEMGHVCRHHARKGYELMLLSDTRDFGLLGKYGGERYKKAYEKIVRKVGSVIHFAYDERQDSQADLFALHLCRNSGWDVELCLNGLRMQILDSHPDWKEDARDGELSTSGLPKTLSPQTTNYLRRLAALRSELDGQFVGDEYGLFQYNDTLGELTPTQVDELADAQEIMVVVHGMESSLNGFLPLMKQLAENDPERVILGYQYPNDASLARSATRLKREIESVCPQTANLKFICHSAGGLVTRYYAEILDGGTEKVVFLGTPHFGSNLARLRSILELKQVLSGFSFNFPEALEKAILDGDGQITFDLEPNSLFLSYLNAQQPTGDQYAIFRGRAISETKSARLQKGFNTTVRVGKVGLLPLKFSATGKRAIARMEKLHIPNEITNGDLAVTLESAELPSVLRITTIDCDHIAIVRNSDVIQQTIQFLKE